ncbi:MAG: CBS domain-containing protein [Armatimonadetes bacterium]|nr:CBS domain-containing protein [Armatimonadota bacterium]
MDELCAGDIMTRAVITARPDTKLREIADLLVRHRISGVPVVDEENRVVGIVSETDLIDEEKRHAHIPRTALYGVMPVPDEVWVAAFEEGDQLTAAQLMTHRVVTLPETTSAREVAEEMLSRHVNRIPITRDGRLVGIVTRADVLRAVAAHWRRG